MKVYGYELLPSRPYVTLLVSIRDQASKIIRETLDKYGLDKENANDYALVQVSDASFPFFFQHGGGGGNYS